MTQGDHYLEIHIDFDKLGKNEFVFVLPCICEWRHTYSISRTEVTMIKGVVYTCPNCGAKVAFLSNDFKVEVNN